jgi:hypothetical protein
MRVHQAKLFIQLRLGQLRVFRPMALTRQRQLLKASSRTKMARSYKARTVFGKQEEI